jgi:WD40 repeat protein
MKGAPNLTRKEFIQGLGLGMAYLAGSRFATAASAPLPYLFKPIQQIPIPTVRVRDITFSPQGELLVTGAQEIYLINHKTTRTFELPSGKTQDRSPVQPMSVAVDSEGTVYTATTQEIHQFAPDGKLLSSWGHQGNKTGEFSYLTSLAVSENNLFVADAGNRKILRFAVNGDYIDELEGFHIPSAYFDVALDARGFLHVTHTSEHRVECYDQNGEKVSEWGQFGGGLENFCGCCNPTNLAVLPNSWLVTGEKGIPRVKVYDPQGKLMACLTTEDLKLSHLLEPGRGDLAFPPPLSASERGLGGEAAALPCHDGWPGLPLAVNSKGQIAIAIPGRATVQVYELVG